MDGAGKIIFMGSGQFAVPALESLVDSGEDVCLVVTQPPKSGGRGKRILKTPVHIAAERAGLDVFTPPKLDAGARDRFVGLSPEFMVVVDYGKILRKKVFSIPRLGCVNVHASLLPSLRGASPVQHAILQGLEVTGVTTMFIDEGLDTGPVLLRREVMVRSGERYLELLSRLAEVGGELLIDTLRGVQSGEVKPVPQDDSLATYAPLIKKEDGRIDWSKEAVYIERMTRAFDPWPSAWSVLREGIIKIFSARVLEPESDSEPGVVKKVNSEGFTVGCGTGDLLVTEVQYQGKRRMSAADFCRGFRLAEGERLG